MDNVTHTLFGLTLARTPLGRAGRGATAALVLASNAPDIDVVATARGAPSYLTWRRRPRAAHGVDRVGGTRNPRPAHARRQTARSTPPAGADRHRWRPVSRADGSPHVV